MSLLAGTWAGEPSAGIEPIPGDPGGLQAAAAGLRAAAGALEDSRARLAGIASGLSGPTWSGEGAASFAKRAEAFGEMHSTASCTLAQGAAALNSFASVLEACQAQVRTAQRQAAEAEAWASQAIASLSSSALPAHDPAAAAQRASAIAAVEDELSRQLGAARALAARAWSTYEAGAQTAAAQLSALVPTWQGLARRVGQWRAYAAAMTPAPEVPAGTIDRIPKDPVVGTFIYPVDPPGSEPVTGIDRIPEEPCFGRTDTPTDLELPTGTVDGLGLLGPTIHINVPDGRGGITINLAKPADEQPDDKEPEGQGSEPEATSGVGARTSSVPDAQGGSGSFSSGQGPMTAEVTVMGKNGEVLSRQEITSGGMTEEQAALGFPQSTLSTHVEAKATSQIPLDKGDTMIIEADRPPCPSCKGVMSRTAAGTGATIVYNWNGKQWVAKP